MDLTHDIDERDSPIICSFSIVTFHVDRYYHTGLVVRSVVHWPSSERRSLSITTLAELVGSVTEWLGTSFERDYDRKVDGSTPTLASLLRPWIRCFTIIISAWWNLTGKKLKKQNSNGKLGNKGNS